MYEFTKELQTGNFQMDAQHRQLLRALNELVEACREQLSPQAVERAARDLYDCAARHMEDEEALQEKYGYPGLEEHRKLHGEFRKAADRMKWSLTAKGAPAEGAQEEAEAAGRWLLRHIRQEDAPAAAYISQKL